MEYQDNTSERGMRTPVARRTLFAMTGAAVLLVPAACDPFSTTKTTRTVTQTAPEPIDPMDTLIAMTRLHLLRLRAGISLGGVTAPKFTQLATDRADHLTRLLAEQARRNRATPSAPGTVGHNVPVPITPALAIRSALDDASAAQLAFSDQVGNVTRYRAALFASISACLSTHPVVLS